MPREDVLIVMVGWNAAVGNKAGSNIVGRFRLGAWSKTGERLIDSVKTTVCSFQTHVPGNHAGDYIC